MILVPAHKHKQTQEKQPHIQYFQEFLEETKSTLKEAVVDGISLTQRYYEEKVYLSYCDDPSQYLFHMLHKNQNETKDQVAQLIFEREKRVTKAIKKKKYKIKKSKGSKSLRKIRDQLSGKIAQMREGIHNLSNIQITSKSGKGEDEELFQGFMEFRKKGYWKEKSQQNQKVKEFLDRMKKVRKDLDADHEKHQKIQEENQRIKQEKQKKIQEKELHKQKQDIKKKIQRAKSQRMKKKDENVSRKKQIHELLRNYKQEKPIFIKNEEKFKKQILQPIQSQRKKKLSDRRKQYQPINGQQLQLHQQRYEEMRQKYVPVEERKQQDQLMYQKNMQKLKQLFHSRFHQNLEEEQTPFKLNIQEKKKIRERILSYSESVKGDFKPKVDENKRKQLQKLMKQLQQQADKGKIKVTNEDGSVTFEQKSPQKQRKIGLSYLQSLKTFNEGKKRKDPGESASMIELGQKPKKKIDYLKEMREEKKHQDTKSKTNKGGWRKIIGSQSFSNKDKYASVMDHVELLEHQAKQKQIELKYVKGGDKVIDIKEQLDRYYLESVAAKMHVLKDVMLR